MSIYRDVHDTINRRTSVLSLEIYDYNTRSGEAKLNPINAMQHAENVIRLNELHKLLDTFHTTVDWGEKE